MPLTSEQRAVAHAPLDRCTIVNAGPGTGKTHVLIERVAWLVETHRIPIGEILVVTFTRKVAREMRERLARRLLEANLLRSAIELETAWVTNFHGLCHRLLRENPLPASFDPGHRVLDQVEAAELASELRGEFVNRPVAERALEAEERGDPLPVEVVNRLEYKMDEAVRILGRARENLLDASALGRLSRSAVDPVRDDPEAREEVAAHEVLLEALPVLERDYESAKQEDGFVDFTDLQTRCVRLLESDAGRLLRGRFKAILVDEFQDTNRAQLRVIELLSPPRLANVLVVGDERQAIYSFRGARLENLRELPTLVAASGGTCETRDLRESFRAYQEILDVSVRALGEATARAPLVATALGNANGAVVQAPSFPEKVDEANGIAEQLERLHGQLVPRVASDGTRTDRALGWGDFAILLRSVGSARAYEDALRARRIPYRTFGGSGFYDRAEILDLLAYLRAIANPFDHLALVRILQRPPFGLSDRSLHGLANVGVHGKERARLEEDAHEHLVITSDRLAPFDALRRALDDRALARELGLTDETLVRLERLRQFLERSIRRRGFVPVSRLLQDVLVETGYGKLLLADDGRGPLETLRRRKNVERLLRLARRHEERHVYGSLDELVSYLQRAIQEEVREEEEGIEADGRVVNLLTVHEAKGCEWPVVFVAGVQDRSWPMSGFPEEIAFFEGAGAVFRREVVGKPGDRKVELAVTRTYGRLHALERDRDLDEERRVLFVAMTRAKNRLFVSGYGKGKTFLDRVVAALGDLGPLPEERRAANAPPEVVAAAPGDVPARVQAALDRIDSSSIANAATARAREVRLSFSHVDTFETCPLRYKLTFVTPLPGRGVGAGVRAATVGEAGSAAELPANELGTIFHDALERWAREEGDLALFVRDAARDRGWSSLHVSDEQRIERFTSNFLASPLGRTRPAPEDVEVPFTVIFNVDALSVSVSGWIDRLDAAPDGTWIVTDYKTNRAVDPERYVLQLSLYRLAVERVLGRRVSACRAYFVRHPDESGLVEVRTLGEAETERRVIEVARRIAARDFAIPVDLGSGVCWACRFGGRDGACPERRLGSGPTRTSGAASGSTRAPGA